MCHTLPHYLFEAGVSEREYDALLQTMASAIEANIGIDMAVGLVCHGLRQPRRDAGRSNWHPPNVAGAIIRWEGKQWSVKTFFISRRSQFVRPDGGRGHFRVEKTILKGE